MSQVVSSIELDEQLDLAAPKGQAPATSGKPTIRRPEDDRDQNGQIERVWRRDLKPSGTGAFRVKTFFCRLRDEAMDTLDQQINEWFDAHPGYEIKNVTTTVGDMVNYKTVEPALIVNIWM